MEKLSLFLTPPYNCSYLTTQQAQVAVVDPSIPMTTQLYNYLLTQGFRRSGNEVYSPYCSHCSACVPVRVPVSEFHCNRQQRRCQRKNQHTQVKIKPMIFDPQHFELYQYYQQQRHHQGSMQYHQAEEYWQFFHSEWCDTILVEFWRESTLIAVAVIDQLPNALSAVYTFFHPQFSQYSLGMYAILWQIHYAKQLALDYVYLGFWIEHCQKMAYKIHYRPLQGLINQQWQYLSA